MKEKIKLQAHFVDGAFIIKDQHGRELDGITDVFVYKSANDMARADISVLIKDTPSFVVGDKK